MLTLIYEYILLIQCPCSGGPGINPVLLLAIIAGMQALQTIKLLVGIDVKHSQLNLYDGFNNQWQQFHIPKQDDCPICHKKL